LGLYHLQESLPLLTALLSLQTPSTYPPFHLTPQKQKERTLQALLQLLMAQAERQATASVWEDVHWADPSSLEFLTLLVEQLPVTKLLLVLTFRPEFTPPWKQRSHLSQLVLNRLGRKQVETMIETMTSGQALSAAVMEQIRLKTDGVPLFVEELTKSVMETEGAPGRVPLQTLAIPATLQEALLARLDRLSSARQIAQLGATLGREFSYELLQAVASLGEADLQAALSKLVDAEILYQRGIGEQARYFFKHALIQDTAYQSLLKITRQQYHHQIAEVLEARFPETTDNQPELVAHHYTEAGLVTQALTYWQRAGDRAAQRSAYAEAITHLTTALELLKTLPETIERTQQELALQVTLGVPLQATKGFAAPEVERVYARARELCQQVGETPQLFQVLWGLWAFYLVRAENEVAHELGEQLLSVAQSVQDSAFLLQAHYALGVTLYNLGDLVPARTHFDQTSALYNPQQHHSLAFRYGAFDTGVAGLSFTALILWLLGYPEQALKKSQEALALANAHAHPSSLAQAVVWTSWFHQLRRDEWAAQEGAEAAIRIATEQGLSTWLEMGAISRGRALAIQGQGAEGVAQLQQGLAYERATGSKSWLPQYLAFLAEAHEKAGQMEEGLRVLADALAQVGKSGERCYEAELYRLKGVLTLQKFQVPGSQFQGPSNPQPLTSNLQAETEAEACFFKAIAIAHHQEAKSWELRASTSLARLWQQQGKKAEAHDLLFEIYHWFTEGFDTKDLQEAKMLLEESAEGQR
jgi:predicted ATPase